MLTACPGEQLTLTCSTNNSTVEILKWTISTPNVSAPFTRIVSIEGEVAIQSLTINETQFTFTRTSQAMSYPFVSEVVIDRIGGAMNGTEVTCMADGTTSDNAIDASEVILMDAVINIAGGNI